MTFMTMALRLGEGGGEVSEGALGLKRNPKNNTARDPDTRSRRGRSCRDLCRDVKHVYIS